MNYDMQPYDPNNIFAKILRGEIPNKTVYEDEHVLAFHDIQPERKVHVLIVPKSAYRTVMDFAEHASDTEIINLWRAVPKVIDALGIREKGFRLINNFGEHGAPGVPHFHLHILGGEPVGPLVVKG